MGDEPLWRVLLEDIDGGVGDPPAKFEQRGFGQHIASLDRRTEEVHLQFLGHRQWHDADLVINWLRAVKSPAELEVLGEAAIIAGAAMQVAYDGVRPGVRRFRSPTESCCHRVLCI